MIDRYKMPGLNPEGTGIAEDMAYGKGKPYKGKLLYDKSYVEQYRKEYTQFGFIEKHLDFANEEPIIPEKEIEEVIIVNKSKKKKNRIVYPQETKFYVSEEDLKRNQERTKEQNKKAIYSREEIENLGHLTKLTTQVKDENFLWMDFRLLKGLLTWGELSPVLDAMIDKFQRNEGGIFEDSRLNENIKDADSTKRYCKYLENYIAEKLKNSFNKLEEVEDKEIDWDDDNKRYLAKRINKNKITGLKNSKGEDQVFTTPLFPYNRYDENNLFEGRTLALNDIWATEVILKELTFDGDDYAGKYKVTLWDHFGLDKPDLEKFYSYGAGFRAWFILQHLRGYKPFITKITFEKEFNGQRKKNKKGSTRFGFFRVNIKSCSHDKLCQPSACGID